MPVLLRLPFDSSLEPAWNRSQESRMVCGRRKELLEVRCNLIEHRRGNRVRAVLAKEALPDRVFVARGVRPDGLRGRVVDELHAAGVVGIEGDRKAAEITTDYRVRRKVVVTALVSMIHDPVVVEVEEHLVLQNRPTDGPTEVVVAQERDRPSLLLSQAEFIGIRS